MDRGIKKRIEADGIHTMEQMQEEQLKNVNVSHQNWRTL